MSQGGIKFRNQTMLDPARFLFFSRADGMEAALAASFAFCSSCSNRNAATLFHKHLWHAVASGATLLDGAVASSSYFGNIFSKFFFKLADIHGGSPRPDAYGPRCKLCAAISSRHSNGRKRSCNTCFCLKIEREKARSWKKTTYRRNLLKFLNIFI